MQNIIHFLNEVSHNDFGMKKDKCAMLLLISYKEDIETLC